MFTVSLFCAVFCCLPITVALLWIKEEIAERMVNEFQGDLTHESILQELYGNEELAGDEQSLAATSMAPLIFFL